jgi:hypothetical protein
LEKINGYQMAVQQRFLAGNDAAKAAEQANRAFTAAKAKVTTNKLNLDEQVKKDCEEFFDVQTNAFDTYLACERAQNARDELQQLSDRSHKIGAAARLDAMSSRPR